MVNILWFLIALYWGMTAYNGGHSDGETDQQMKQRSRFKQSPRAEYRENLREWSNPEQRYQKQRARLMTQLAELEKQHNEIQPQASLQ